MHISIDEIANRSKINSVIYSVHRKTFACVPDKSIEADLRAFGLDNIDSRLVHQSDNEWYRFASEIRLSDVKVDVHKLENHNKKLTEDILQSQKSIKALKE